MARIIYGVNGEGLGHATRSKPVISSLSKKHEIKIFAGRRAYDYLSKKIPVERIYAFDIIYEKNGVALLKTFIKNLVLFPIFGITSLVKVFNFMKRFKPDLVITDFEPITHFTAKLLRIPVISLDNQHILTNCKIRFSKKFLFDYLASKFIIVLFGFLSDYYIVTTFFYPEIRSKNTFLLRPILREKITKLKPKIESHIVVYQTSRSYEHLVPLLKEFNKEEFRIYKSDKIGAECNVIFRGFDEDEFLRDLATCKAVITNGGFSLISEAIYLGKPILSVPVKKQFEQILNAINLSRAGFGEHHRRINHDALKNFIDNIPKYQKKLKGHHEYGNKKVIKKIEEIINGISSDKCN